MGDSDDDSEDPPSDSSSSSSDDDDNDLDMDGVHDEDQDLDIQVLHQGQHAAELLPEVVEIMRASGGLNVECSMNVVGTLFVLLRRCYVRITLDL